MGERQTAPRWRCLSGTALKMIAVVSMLIDHTSVALIENVFLGGQFALIGWRAAQMSPLLAKLWTADFVLRRIGRLAFPIFAFLLAEGFLHTRDVKKYAVRLFLFGLISEIPFDWALFGMPFYWGYQNVYWTLFLGLVLLACIREFKRRDSAAGQCAAWLVCLLAAEGLHTDYGAAGVMFIALLYYARSDAGLQTLFGVVSLLAAVMVLGEPAAVLAFIPIRMYDGTRGRRDLKYFFYWFYPLHLALLCLIRTAAFG